MHPAGQRPLGQSTVDFAQRPMLVFWETTRACHSRAGTAAPAPPWQALPGELSHAEGIGA